MKIFRPLWEDGAALAPQQFQQQARWNAQGQWNRDPSFIPPMLSVAASPSLVAELSDLLVPLQARRRRLMAMRRDA